MRMSIEPDKKEHNGCGPTQDGIVQKGSIYHGWARGSGVREKSTLVRKHFDRGKVGLRDKEDRNRLGKKRVGRAIFAT